MYDYSKMKFERLIDLRDEKQREKTRIGERKFLTREAVDRYVTLCKHIQAMNVEIAARNAQLPLEF